VYVRLMDDRELPELRGLGPDAPARLRCRALNDALLRWIEITPALVVNRSGPQSSNGSKPYQAQLIARAGLRVPETLVTNDPDAVIDFRDRHRRVVYKSISGVRSIVRELGDEDLARLDSIRWCPTQFQAYVDGTDVRVHCVGEEVFATAIHAEATDYRYAHSGGESPHLEAVELPDALAERCVALTADLGLEFAGLDLRIGPDGTEAWCFEANPSPAFTYYEDGTGQPIAAALARRLASA
jgi:glutathione synthase/RimK-type ligase-like ATP-grasp enzyme